MGFLPSLNHTIVLAVVFNRKKERTCGFFFFSSSYYLVPIRKWQPLDGVISRFVSPEFPLRVRLSPVGAAPCISFWFRLVQTSALISPASCAAPQVESSQFETHIHTQTVPLTHLCTDKSTNPAAVIAILHKA